MINNKTRFISLLLTMVMLLFPVQGLASTSGSGSGNDGGGASVSVSSSAATTSIAYTYTLSDMQLTTLSGKAVTLPSGSCMASVTVTNNKQTTYSNELLLFAAYDQDGRLVSFTPLRAAVSQGSSAYLSAQINVPADKEISQVKAFIWDSLESAMPLSNSVEVNEPSPIYTAKGVVTQSYRTNADFAPNTFEFEFTDGLNIPEIPFMDAGETYILTIDSVDPTDYPGIPLDATFEIINDEPVMTSYAFDTEGADIVTLETDWAESWIDSTIHAYSFPGASEITSYTIDDSADLYINGVDIGYAEADCWNDYIAGNPDAPLVLVDSNGDSMYDVMYLVYYASAQVDSLSDEKIYFSSYSYDSYSSIRTNYTDVTYQYTLDDKAIDRDDLEEGDVLLIQYDVSGSFKDSDFYIVRAARNSMTEIYNGADEDNETLTFGDTAYRIRQWYYEEYTTFADYISDEFVLSEGDLHTVYFDAFGRIYDAQYILSAERYGIVEKVIPAEDSALDESDGYYSLVIYNAAGDVETYPVDITKVSGNWKWLSDVVTMVYNDDVIDNENKQPIQNRVVEFWTNQDGEITKIESRTPKATAEENKFRPLTGAIGSVRLSENTCVVDATLYTTTMQVFDLNITSYEVFAEDIEYTAYAFGSKYSDDSYVYVIVTDANVSHTSDTPLAILSRDIYEVTSDGQTTYAIEALISDGDDETELLLASNVVVNVLGTNVTDFSSALSKGDVVFYTQNPSGQIQKIDVLFQGSAYMQDDDLSAMKEDAFSNNIQLYTPVDSWTTSFNTWTSKSVQLVFGPIVDKYISSISIGKIADATVGDYTGPITNRNHEADDSETNAGILEVGLDSAAKVYRYSAPAPSRNNLEKGAKSDLVRYGFSATDLLEYGTIIPWNQLNPYTEATFVLAKIVNGVLTDAVIFVDYQ